MCSILVSMLNALSEPVRMELENYTLTSPEFLELEHFVGSQKSWALPVATHGGLALLCAFGAQGKNPTFTCRQHAC